MGFDRHEFSRVQLTKSDIKPVDAIYKLILPQRHLGHWEALCKKKTLDPDAEKIVNEIIEKKTKELSKKKRKKFSKRQMKVIQLMKVPMEMLMMRLMMRMMKKLNLQSKNKQSYLIILKSN